MLNPLEFKHDIASRPLKWMLRQPHLPDDSQYHTQAVMMAVTGMVTAAFNLAPAWTLIQSGYRGQTYFSGLSIGYHASGFPRPMFNYITPASRAERIGGAVGARIGSRVMQLGGHLAPGVGWLPGHKLPLSPWIKKSGLKAGAKIGARVGGRLIPGVGWALLAYDVYDIAWNRSLWGFDF